MVMLALAAIIAGGAWLLLPSRAAPRSSAPSAIATQAAEASPGAGNRDGDAHRAKAAPRLKREATSPLPPRGAPLAQIYDDLKARADVGDAAAASRLYHDIGRCKAALNSIQTLQGVVADSSQGNDSDASPDTLGRRTATVAVAHHHQAKSGQLATSQCADLAPAQLQIMPVALRAAQLGDNDAADCYVGMPVTFARGLVDHPEWLEQYKENALALADAAIRRGDWTMVEQLQDSYAKKGVDGGDLLHQLTGTDPAMAYRYSRLALLAMAEHPDVPRTVLDQQRTLAMESLPGAAIQAGDAWADDAHRRYFSANPDGARTSEMGVCELGHDEAPVQ